MKVQRVQRVQRAGRAQRVVRGRSTSAVTALAATAVLAGFLAGCAPDPDLSDAAATQLQAGVLEVTRAAAADDLSAARTALDALTKALAAEEASGRLSPEREARISAAIDLVSADLRALEEAAQAKAKAEADARAAAAEAAAEEAAQAAEDAKDAEDDKKDRGRDKD